MKTDSSVVDQVLEESDAQRKKNKLKTVDWQLVMIIFVS